MTGMLQRDSAGDSTNLAQFLLLALKVQRSICRNDDNQKRLGRYERFRAMMNRIRQASGSPILLTGC